MPTAPKRPKPQAQASGIACSMLRIAQDRSQGVRPCEEIGRILQASRKACGLSQKHVAEHLQVSTRTVKRWERGLCLPAGFRQDYLFAYLELTLQDVLQMKVKSYAGDIVAPLDRFTDLLV